MAETSDVAQWPAGLSDSGASRRAAAAREIFRAGTALCEDVLRRFSADPEMRGLLCTYEKASAPAPTDAVVIVVGVAVSPEDFEKIRAANGAPALANVPPDQDAKEFELHFENHTNLDILTTRDPAGSGALARHLRRFGAGIQQVEIYVNDVDRATEILRARFGLEPIYPATRPGASGTRVNFFLAPTPAGQKVLIELVEAR